MASTVTPDGCHWMNCEEHPVAVAVYGAPPGIIHDGWYCAEHIRSMQEAFRGNNLAISTDNGWVTATDMLTQEIP